MLGIFVLACLAGNVFADDLKDQIATEEWGQKDVYTEGVWIDVMTYDKVYDVTPGMSYERIDSSVQAGLRTGKKPVIVIEESEKWDYEWKLRDRGLEDDVELIIR